MQSEAEKAQHYYTTALAEAYDADPVLSVSEWANLHRMLPQKGAAEPGPYRTERTPYMREIMDCLSATSPVQEVILMAGAQLGKALALDTPIPTPGGWKTMGEIMPGDMVLGDAGEPVRVKAVSPVQHGRACHRVWFSDGSSVVCDGAHLWTVDEYRRGRALGERTATLDELVADGIGQGQRYAVRAAGALQLPAADLPVDPYTLGRQVVRGGVPAQYLRASREQREALLQGMMDACGSVAPDGRCVLCAADAVTAGHAYELMVSLGFVVSRAGLRLTFTRGAGSRRIVSVTPVQSVPVRCIAVESERKLYLCGHAMIPTHNSEAGNNWVGYTVDYAPGPMLLVQPTVDNAKRYSKQRISPMFQESPRLAAKVTDNKSRDSSNTQLEKEFPGGILILGGANSAAGLRSMPIRYLFADEISNWPHDVDGEGDPLELATARTTTFARRKIYKCSTPKVRGTCRIEAEYEASDQRRYFVPCPHCQHMQTLDWANFIIPKNAEGKAQPSKAHMACPECGGVIEEHHKTAMLAGGEWRPTNLERLDTAKRGYQISTLYSPAGWKSWAQVAKQWVAAQGNPKRLQTFINNVLAETWQEEGERVEAHHLMERAEDYGTETLPDGVVVLTAGIDVQPNRIELEVLGWGCGEETWSIDYVVLWGDPNGPLVWQELDHVLLRIYQHPSGVQLRVCRSCIDTGGANTQAVYEYVKLREHMGVLGIKGMPGEAKPIMGNPTRSNLAKIPLFPVGTFAAKDTIYGRLRIEEPGPGYCHFPRRYGAEFYKGLTAEECRIKFNKGFAVREWHKPEGARNEPLDCRVYNLAAFASLNVNVDQLVAAMNASGGQGGRRVRGGMMETA